MEELLRQLLEVNKEMLREMRLLRQALSGGFAAGLSQPEAPAQEEPPVPGEAQRAKTPPPRFTPEDLEAMHGTLVSGITRRNRAKSDAFEEFQKRHKDW